MVYLKEIKYTSFVPGNSLEFIFSDGTIMTGKVHHALPRDTYFIDVFEGQLAVFRKLNIDLSKYDIFSKLCGYKLDGAWPEAKTLSDAKKFVESLIYVNNPTPQTLITKGNIVTVPKRNHIKLNFNI